MSFLFCVVSTVPFYPRKKKGNERAGREKGKNGPDVLTSLFAFSLLLSSQLMLCLLREEYEFFSFLGGGGRGGVRSFVTFCLYLICCLLK